MWRKRKPIISGNSDLVSSTSEQSSSRDLVVADKTKDDPEAEEEVDSEKKSLVKKNLLNQKRKTIDDDEDGEWLRRKHAFIKSSIRTDYQPDICKDYKETGFCGFGDSCKFLHDRSDYKHGWQLDQAWSKGEPEEEDDDKYLIKDDDEKEDDTRLTHCPVCQESFKNPVETKCKHYFCVDCAEKECSEKCYTCQSLTSGIFKNAKKSLEELRKKEQEKS